MNITLTEYLSLAIGYKEFAIVDNDRATMILTEPGYYTLAHLEPLDTGLFQLWHKKDWLASGEHQKELKKASEAYRARTNAKAEVYAKLKRLLGLAEGRVTEIAPLLEAMKAKSRGTLIGLGLTSEEIDLI
jgi:hypothetical protein